MLGGTSRLMHMPVLDVDGRFIGTVHEVYINPSTMQLGGVAAGDHLIAAKAIKSISYKITLSVDSATCFRYEAPKHQHASHNTHIHA